MVIDDSQEILELMAMILADEGYDPILSITVTQDLTPIKQARPDLIILDYMLGGAGGSDLLSKLQQDGDTAPIPIIICSAAVRQLQDMADHLAVQGVVVVYKPFDVDHLLATVQRVLRERD